MHSLSLLFLSSFIIVAGYSQTLRVGASRTDRYIEAIKGKKVAVLANTTSRVGSRHLVDTLVSLGVELKVIFGPEHGFRGTADAGEHVGNSVDKATGIPVISLYGNHPRPSREELGGIEIVLFDIQDVGVRFYTYISTMHYMMEACADEGIKMVILDRPNPNGYYVDGPVLDMKFKSFVGMHPVALVHGMTVGEYALMINGEGWLGGGRKCNLEVIPCEGYTHAICYDLPVKPSPNLPNARSVELYPSLGLLEGTVMSCGRGTDFPFQAMGHPAFNLKTFTFRPRSIPGASKIPPFIGQDCFGIDLRASNTVVPDIAGRINIELITFAYTNTSLNKNDLFFNSFFTKLAGTDRLREQIEAGIPADTIRASWGEDLLKFKEMRKKYLLYEDFEK